MHQCKIHFDGQAKHVTYVVFEEHAPGCQFV